MVITKLKKRKEKVIDNVLATKFGIYNIAKDSVYFVNFFVESHQDVPKYLSCMKNQKLQQKKRQTNFKNLFIRNGSSISEMRSQDNKTDGLLV
jgi:hypothetical protein